MCKIKIRKNDKRLKAFVNEVTATLLDGQRHQTPGFGTFSACTRKATADQGGCKIAMFRACTELREYASGGPKPTVSGPHAEVVDIIVDAMQSEEGINVPFLGHMAVVPGKKPKLIFHGAKELNNALDAS
jgi:hypothetical protein